MTSSKYVGLSVMIKLVIIWHINVSCCKEIKEVYSIKDNTAVTALKFLSKFVETFDEAIFDNVILVSKSSLSNRDERIDHLNRRMIASQKYMIKFNTMFPERKDKKGGSTGQSANAICNTNNLTGRRTLYVVLDIDTEIIKWLANLTSNQLADCSWLIVFPTNATLTLPESTLPTKKNNSYEIENVGSLFSPFKSILNITLISKMYVLVIPITSTVTRSRKAATPQQLKHVSTLNIYEIFRTKQFNGDELVETNEPELLWNVLGTFYEKFVDETIEAESFIQYVSPKENIWLRRGDLGGTELRIGYAELQPHIYHKISDKTGIRTYHGIMQDMLDIIAQKINCTWSVIPSNDGTFGSRFKNGSWSGLVGMLIEKKIDMSLVDLTVTSDRAKVIDFTEGILARGHGLFMLRPEEGVSWTTFRDVFHWKMWCTWGLCFVALLFIFYVIYCFDKREATITIDSTFATVAGGMLALSIPIQFKRIPGRILMLTVCVTGALIIWSYSAGLISYLTIHNYIYPIHRLQDITNNPEYKVVVEKGSAEMDYFDLATKKSNRDGYLLWTNGQVSVSSNRDKTEQNVMDDSKLIYFGDTKATQFNWENIPCLIVNVASKPYFQVTGAWAFQKNSPYTPLFNFYISELREGGMIDRLQRKTFLQRKHVSKCEKEQLSNDGDGQFEPIKLNNIVFAFAILWVGMILSLVSLYVENQCLRN